MDPVTQPVPQTQKPSFFTKYKFTLISLGIIILAAIPLLLLSNSAQKKAAVQQQQPVAIASPTPTSAPLTVQNADSTLQQTDTDLQNTLNQVDTDLKSVSQVDSSQDTTAGL